MMATGRAIFHTGCGIFFAASSFKFDERVDCDDLLTHLNIDND